MLKRITLITLFIMFTMAGFVGGLVLTGRMRSAGESQAQDAAPSEATAASTQADARRHRPRSCPTSLARPSARSRA